MIDHVFATGAFGHRVAQHLAERQPALVIESRLPATAPAAPADPAHPGVTLLALSSARLAALRQARETLGRAPWLAVFPVGATVVVTPLFRPGGVCAHCFTRRLESYPPAPLQQEVLAAHAAFCDREADYEQTSFHGLAPRIAAELAVKHARHASNVVSTWNMAGLTSASAPIVPLHGCACRPAAEPARRGVERFVAFKVEASSWLA